MAPEAKPETCDTKDQIDKMVQKEIRIAEALREHPDAVWCGSSQDAPHMRDNLKALFLARIKHENQEPGNTFRLSDPCSMNGTTVNVFVKKKPIPGAYWWEYGFHVKNEEYSMKTNTYTKEDGISVISVKTITQNGWSTNDQKRKVKDYRDTIGLWRKKLKESE